MNLDVNTDKSGARAGGRQSAVPGVPGAVDVLLR